jgi:hypothetical protein
MNGLRGYVPPPYSTELINAIVRTITIERLHRYLKATGNDPFKAMELYELNVKLSAILYGLLNGLEVAVRNAEHIALTNSYGTPRWYDTPIMPNFGKPNPGCEGPSWHDYAPLSEYWRDKVNEAKTSPGIGNRPGKIIAELTFGFWVDLLQTQNHWSLWVGRKLHLAFPNARRHRKLIHERLKAVQLLRNRISHHEPIITSTNTLYNGDGYISLGDIIETVEWVCPHTALWLKTQFGYEEADQILKAVAALKITL